MNNNLATQGTDKAPASSIYENGKFRNPATMQANDLSKIASILSRYFYDKSADAVPSQALPMEKVTQAQLIALSDDKVHVIKLGHSSILLKVFGEFWLLDPVFSERASPFSFMGPKRFHENPVSIEALPDIDKVLISHNHYDHLDKASVKQLADKTRQFWVPLGVGNDLEKWGVTNDKITEFDWWQEQVIPNGLVAFTPTQHFSGRAITDGNKSLWGSWVILAKDTSLYFSGDSGYFSGFKDIGERYGPFDLTMIETGAYDKDWSDIHMTPEQSVQAHIDLKGKAMMPVHNGTFDLAFHAWYEPLERVKAAADSQQVQLFTPIVGEAHELAGNMQSAFWWQAFMPDTDIQLTQAY